MAADLPIELIVRIAQLAGFRECYLLARCLNDKVLEKEARSRFEFDVDQACGKNGHLYTGWARQVASMGDIITGIDDVAVLASPSDCVSFLRLCINDRERVQLLYTAAEFGHTDKVHAIIGAGSFHRSEVYMAVRLLECSD